MCMGTGLCGSPRNLAYSISQGLMFSSEVGRAMQMSSQLKQCNCKHVLGDGALFLCGKQKNLFQLILVNNTPIADVLRFVSKTFRMLLVTHTAEQQSYTLPWLRGVRERGLCLFASFFLLRKLGSTEEVLITSVKEQEVRTLSN